MVGIVTSILEQGFIYGIMAVGVYISYKILDFPDLSVDGTFPLGAAFMYNGFRRRNRSVAKFNISIFIRLCSRSIYRIFKCRA